jgi:diaminopimelate epimerase
MNISFHKFHGCGNDFIVVDLERNPGLERLDLASLVPRWCDRHFGVGADQVLVMVGAPKLGSVRIRVLNSDGSESGMCGNGLRCIARYTVEQREDCSDLLAIEISGATYEVAVARSDAGKFVSATVNMGQPRLHASEIPVLIPGESVIDTPIVEEIARLLPTTWRERGFSDRFSCVNMGNPHAIFFGAQANAELAASIGPLIERCALFPKRTNVHFCRVESERDLRVFTWERGSGPTLACGSGACAVAVAAALSNRAASDVHVHMPGGTLDVRWDRASGDVFLSGPSAHVFSGVLLGP